MRVDGQRSVYVPVLKQGGDTNTIAVVDGIKSAIKTLFDVPKELVTQVVVRSIGVCEDGDRNAAARRRDRHVSDVADDPGFPRQHARHAWPYSFRFRFRRWRRFCFSGLGGGSVNSMVLGGLALAFSRLIDNSVVVLENIYRHLELGKARRWRRKTAGVKSRCRCSRRH